MAGDIVPFQGMDKNALAAYLSDPAIEAAQAYNDDVANYASFPTISIKGKTFTLVEGDDRKVMMKPEAPDEVAQSLQLVILRANDKARTYYEKGYSDQADAERAKPTCFSNDNIAPSDLSVQKQNDKCQTCRWAVFGSAVRQDGTAGKGTRCSSNARLAVAPPDALDRPHMLRVPPTSLKPLRDAIEVIRKRNIVYPLVIMKISFVPEEASPLLKFIPVGLLSKAPDGGKDGLSPMQRALAMREDSTVRAIVGLDERAPAAAATPLSAAPSVPAVQKDELGDAMDNVLAAATAPVAPPKPPASPAAPSPAPVAPPVAAPAPTQAASPSPSAPVAPPPAASTPAMSPTSPTVTVASGDLIGELGGLLSNLDG